ncbi:MAG TPA: helix-turn-helix domain-containing protein [Luteimicrobium sp.]|nr:helix-turn-helix domain-containing protein [Luteimicrobium sp.]
MSTREPAYLTVQQVMDELGLTEYMVRSQHKQGALKGVRLGRLLRFEPSAVEDFKRRLREDAPAPTAGLSPLSRRRRLSRH